MRPGGFSVLSQASASFLSNPFCAPEHFSLLQTYRIRSRFYLAEGTSDTYLLNEVTKIANVKSGNELFLTNW